MPAAADVRPRARRRVPWRRGVRGAGAGRGAAGDHEALWALYPEYPPYGRKGNDPAPHCTLGRLEGDHAITLEQAKARVEPLLPVRCEVTEATLFVEHKPVEMRVRATFPFGA